MIAMKCSKDTWQLDPSGNCWRPETGTLLSIALISLATLLSQDHLAAQTDIYTPLTDNVGAVSCSTAGPVFGVDPSWVPIVGGDEDTSQPSVFAMARSFGNGRVVLVGHDGLVSESGLGTLDNAKLVRNMLNWLKQTNALNIGYTTGHGEWQTALPLQQVLTNTQATIAATPAPITSQGLDTLSVLIVGNAWGQFTAQEVESVRQFVNKGGGLLLLGLGWSWRSYNPATPMTNYPMHVIAAPYGGRWLTSFITDPTNQTNGYPLFRTFYPNVVSCTSSGAMTTIAEAHKTLGSGLSGALETDGLLRTRLIAAHVNLATINTELPISDPLRVEVADFYSELARSRSDLYARSSPIDQAAYPTSVWLRERAWRTLRDSLELTPTRKESIANAVQLSGRRRDLFLNFDLIVLDNCRLAADQLEFLYQLISLVPKELHDLAAISVADFLGTPPVRIGLEGLGGQVNTFGISINSTKENQFPPDVPSGFIPVYCSALAHEVNHVVDAFTIGWETNSSLATRRQQLIRDAGTNDLNYLRGMGSFFTANPQEFFASIANQWFADSKKTFDLANIRASLGRTGPINQALFFADVYSGGKNNTYFYRTDTNGYITRETVPLSRDPAGRVNGIYLDEYVYSFEIDKSNNVSQMNILSNNTDLDGDGLSDAAEATMQKLGFDWKVSQPELVAVLYSNANRAQLFSQTQYDLNRTAGRSDVLNTPSAFGLYTSDSITDLRMGGLMIQKQGNNTTVVFQTQTTTNLSQPFTNIGTPITNAVPMTGDKGFLRIQAR